MALILSDSFEAGCERQPTKKSRNAIDGGKLMLALNLPTHNRNTRG